MLDAILAEGLKLRRHQATWLMVWIFPLAIAVVTVGALVYHLIAGTGPRPPAASAAAWVLDSTVLLRFPASGAGRALTLGFTALVFAGEYGWNTWKLVVPARVRWQLIVAKWIVVFGFVVAAMVAADLIGLAARWIEVLRGYPIPAGVTLGDLAAAHARAACFALVPIAFTIALAALFAIMTRSLLAAVILSFALLIAEGLLPFAAIYFYPRAPGVVTLLVDALPFFHLQNIAGWAKGAGVRLPLGPATIVAMPLATSLAAVGAWLLAATVPTFARFVQQDLN